MKGFIGVIKLLKTDSYNLIGKLLLFLFCFLLPVNQKLSTILIILMVFYSFIIVKNIDLKELFRYTPFFVFYFLFIIANYDEGKFGINMFEQKASLIAFPIIFATIKLIEQDYKNVLKYYVYGCFFIFLSSTFLAFYNSISIGPFSFNPMLEDVNVKGAISKGSVLLTNYFLGNNFIQNMNGTFLSVYFSFALFISLNFKNFIKYRTLIIFCLVLGILQIFSVTGLICMILVLILSIKPKFYKTILFVIFSSFIFLSGMLIYNYHKKEHLELIQAVEKVDNRAIIWPIAIETVVHNPFGLGKTNAQEALQLKFPKYGAFGYESQLHKIDAHNMYLQILLELGIIGFLLFIYIIFQFFRVKREMLYIDLSNVFILLNLVLFLTESSLVTYAGLSFFCFFYCFFYSNTIKH
ncbi:O-antigen ligase family protein [Olleya namhaensis]|uniref:O-antigen ligase family protein n=1 Tax=Olleya namhaensis TaxID=1144750 RepID=UPI00232BCECA|nr:O-antigen ligase family protein [Olleya namhaensis]